MHTQWVSLKNCKSGTRPCAKSIHFYEHSNLTGPSLVFYTTAGSYNVSNQEHGLLLKPTWIMKKLWDQSIPGRVLGHELLWNTWPLQVTSFTFVATLCRKSHNTYMPFRHTPDTQRDAKSPRKNERNGTPSASSPLLDALVLFLPCLSFSITRSFWQGIIRCQLA